MLDNGRTVATCFSGGERGESQEMLKKIDHVGIVVEDFVRVLERFGAFGLSCKEVVENKSTGVRAGFFLIGESQIEVLSYPDKKSADSIVHAQKGAINHLCFEVDNLEESIHDFQKHGAKLVGGFPRAGARGRIAFFDPETTENVLIELCQL